VDNSTIWTDLAAPLPPFDELVKSYLTRQPGHDVSDEPRDGDNDPAVKKGGSDATSETA